MRAMVKFSFPTESGNAAIKSGKLEKVFQKLIEDLKPEASYSTLKETGAPGISSSPWATPQRLRAPSSVFASA